MNNNNEHIDRLIVRYISGEATPEEALQLERWMDESPENKKYFGDIRFVNNKTVASHKYIKVNTEKAWDKVSNQMKRPKESETQPTKFVVPVYKLQWFRIAASIILIIGISAIVLTYINRTHQIETEIILSSTDSTINRTIKGTTEIFLNKNSKIVYTTKQSGKEKEIILTGEAFIKVHHSKDTTLIVRAQETYIRDIGTSFNVKAYPNNNKIEVYVESGEVIFYSENQQGITLQQGETGIYNKTNKEFSKQTAETPNVISYKTKLFVFRNTRLADAVAALNDVYPEQITIANPKLADCTLTVTFDNESINNIVSIIAETMGLETSTDDTRFILNGQECQSK